MENIIYIKSLHRPYNQNLNSIKWVCKFIERKNSKHEISKSDFYLEFYIYLLKKFYNLYNKNINEPLTHGIPSYDSIKNSYLHIRGLSKEKKRVIISNSISSRQNEMEKSIFSTYKAFSYFINLAKDKLDFVDNNNELTSRGVSLMSLKSNDFILSTKQRSIVFLSILRNDFHFFISLLLLKKFERKINNLSIEELHYDFLSDRYNVRHFNFTQASQLNFSKVREYWIRDLDILDKNSNIKKRFIDIIILEGFEIDFREIQIQVKKYYKEKIISKSKFQNTLDLFKEAYTESNKNELGFLSLQEIADKMKISKNSFQSFISQFYESEKSKYNIFFNNTVQLISGKNQYFIRNRPVVNIKIKELN